MKFSYTYIIILFVLHPISFSLFGKTVGSNFDVSRQTRIYFPEISSGNNTILGFSVIEKGITFENDATSCDFDAFFHLSGDIVLNGGTLRLQQNLSLQDPLFFGAGVLDGNGLTIEFPKNLSELQLPTNGHKHVLVEKDSVSFAQNVTAVDWSYDNAYVAFLTSDKSDSNIYIYSFDGTSLSLEANININTKLAESLQWHPSDYQLVVGFDTSNGLQLYEFDGVSTINLLDTENISKVKSVAWHPTGNYVAIGHATNSSVKVYPVSAGLFGSVIDGPSSISKLLSSAAISWDSTGNYLAVGSSHRFGNTLHMYDFNGSTLTAAGGLSLSGNVYSVAFKPNSTILAVGLGFGRERLRLYQYDPQMNTLTQFDVVTAATHAKTVYYLDWRGNSIYLGLAKDHDTESHELEVYCFRTIDNSLHLITGIKKTNGFQSISWTSDGLFIAAHDETNNGYVYGFDIKKTVFKDTKVFFDSDVTLYGSIEIQGNCSFHVGGNTLDINTGELIISPESTLIVDGAVIRGIHGTNIQCADNSSVIGLRDVIWIQDGTTTFTLGAVSFEKSVRFQGEGTTNFAYQSIMTSTIQSHANLYLDSNFTFSYDPPNEDKNLLLFSDSSSILSLNGGTLHATGDGLQLKKGKISIERNSFISSEGTNFATHEGIIIGSGLSADDAICEFVTSSNLNLLQGALTYKNVLSDSWIMKGKQAQLNIVENAALRLLQNLNVDQGTLIFQDNTTLARASGKKATGFVKVLNGLTFLSI